MAGRGRHLHLKRRLQIRQQAPTDDAHAFRCRSLWVQVAFRSQFIWKGTILPGKELVRASRQKRRRTHRVTEPGPARRDRTTVRGRRTTHGTHSIMRVRSNFTVQGLALIVCRCSSSAELCYFCVNYIYTIHIKHKHTTHAARDLPSMLHLVKVDHWKSDAHNVVFAQRQRNQHMQSSVVFPDAKQQFLGTKLA